MNYKLFFLLFLTLCVVSSCLDDTEDTVEETPKKEDANTIFINNALKEVNMIRASEATCGTTPYTPVAALIWNDQLAAAALRHAKDMQTNNFFNHKGSDGSQVDKRVTDAGYNWATVGENIAKGYNSLSSVMAGWKGSATHCKNLMSADYTEVGIANVGDIWVQVLAKKR
jgi:uncharacterized protein YkwD